MVKNASISIVLFKGKTLANGEHPIVLRITKDKQRKHLSLGISCSADLWDFDQQKPKRNHPNKLTIEAIIEKKNREYREQVLEFNAIDRPYTPESLSQVVEKPSSMKAAFVLQFYEEMIARLKLSQKIGNANAYRDAKNSLRTFNNQKDFLFSDVDMRFLNRYEVFLRSRNLADTSIAAYFRSFRALFNKAISEGIVKKDYYPFDEFKIAKFKTRTQKRSINKEDVIKIIALDLGKEPLLFEARQYFVFSYLGQGINFTDMAQIRWKEIMNDRVYYTRSKTSKVFNFGLAETAKHILAYFRPLTFNSGEDYVFPILNIDVHKTPVQIKNRIQKVLKKTNRSLKTVGQKAEIALPLSTYVARHTYADTLRKSGAGIQLISQALDHAEVSTTRIYLRDFAHEDIDKANEVLL
jgi:site-specific recombinase XerD